MRSSQQNPPDRGNENISDELLAIISQVLDVDEETVLDVFMPVNIQMAAGSPTLIICQGLIDPIILRERKDGTFEKLTGKAEQRTYPTERPKPEAGTDGLDLNKI